MGHGGGRGADSRPAPPHQPRPTVPSLCRRRSSGTASFSSTATGRTPAHTGGAVSAARARRLTRTATRTLLAYDTAHWHGALEDHLFVHRLRRWRSRRPKRGTRCRRADVAKAVPAKEAEARALAVADIWRGGGGGSVLTRAWRAVAFVTHEEQDLALCTLMDTRLGAAGRGGEARRGGADRGRQHATGGAAPRETAVAARQGRPRREALWRVWSSTAIGERRGHS